MQTSTPNLLLQSIVGEPLLVSPAALGPVEPGSMGPFTFTVVGGRPPTDKVTVSLTTDAQRAVLEPRSLTFSGRDWATPQRVTVTSE